MLIWLEFGQIHYKKEDFVILSINLGYAEPAAWT